MDNSKPAWKKYRDALKEKLDAIREGNMENLNIQKWVQMVMHGKKAVAQNLLEKEQQTNKYQSAKKEKFKHFRVQQGVEIIENALKEGNINIIIKNTNYGQKWILAIDPREEEAFFMSEDRDYHRELLREVKKNESKNSYLVCLGGGRMEIDNKQNIIFLYSYSNDYGEVNEKLQPYVIKALKKQYPSYAIKFQAPYKD